MTVISTNDLARMRRAVARKLPVVTYHKARANDVFQAVEDWEVGGHTSVPTETRQGAMETAAGVSLITQQEIAFWEVWSQWKSGRL